MSAGALDNGFEQLCAEALAREGVPGAAIGVLAGGEEWVRAFGVLESGGGAAVRPESTFRIASITKPFTATLALYLAVSGALDFAETIPAPEPDVTVRHALAHVVGFEDDYGDLGRFGEGDDALARLADSLVRQRQLVPPGELWSYCNGGYWLLGHVVADRTGTPYETALEDWVLRPLRLDTTGFGEPDAVGHDPDAARLPYARARRPSGGLVSNVPDLLAFARHHLEAPETASLREPAAPTPGGWQGFGWALDRVGELELWGHPGGWGGYESLLAFEPEHGFAFAGLTNAAGGKLALRELHDAAVELALGVRREPAPAARLPRVELELLSGRYAQPSYEVAFAPEDEGLGVEAVAIGPDGGRTPQPHAHARPLGGRLFELVDGPDRGARFDFHVPPGRPEDERPAFVRFSSRLAERDYETA